MLPADIGGKINYSPGTFLPVRKFGSCAVWRLSGKCTLPRGGVTRPGRFGKPPLDQTAPLPEIHLSPACVLIRIATARMGGAMKFEDAGRAVDREVAKLADFLDKKLKPETRQEMATLLHRASRHLDKLARNLEKEEPGTSDR